MRHLVIHEVLTNALTLNPQGEVVSGNKRFTYEQLHGRILRLADQLKSLGIEKGTVVGVMDVNSHRYLELQYALAMLGAIVHTLNFRLSAQDLLYTVNHAQDEWLFVWEGFADAVGDLHKSFPHWVWLTEGGTPSGAVSGIIYEELVDAGAQTVPDEAYHVKEEDPFSIFYTTGTTGKPKGLMYRHRDMLQASLQILHHLALHPTGAQAHSQDVFMPLIPFFHIHAWGTAFFVPYLGAKLVLPERSGPAEQLELIHKESVTWSNMVPTQLQMLLEQAEKNGTSLPLKVLTGGSQLTSGSARRAGSLGVQFSLIYGGSDQLATSISVLRTTTEMDLVKKLEFLSTRTYPLPMVEVEIRTETSGLRIPPDGKTMGEVWVRSPWLPRGYLNDPERTKDAYISGWFRSGDLAIAFSDQTFYVVDREKDAIKSGGEWIPSGVLEAVISEHPKVDTVAVLAKKDERWGERPIAVIRGKETLTGQEIKDFLLGIAESGKIPKYWVPDDILVVHELPLTSAGKLNKAALKKELKI